MTGKAPGLKGAVLSQRIDGVWQPLPGLTAKVKLLAPGELPHRRRQAGRPGAEGPGRALRPAGSRRAEPCPAPSSRRSRARRSSCSSSTGRRLVDGRSRRPPTSRAGSPQTCPAPACTARGRRPRRGSPRAFRDSSRCHDPARARLPRGGAAALHRRDAARYAVGAASVADLPRLQRALGRARRAWRRCRRSSSSATTAPRLSALPGATYVERLGVRRLAPGLRTTPLKQWHLTVNRAFDFWESARAAAAAARRSASR